MSGAPSTLIRAVIVDWVAHLFYCVPHLFDWVAHHFSGGGHECVVDSRPPRLKPWVTPPLVGEPRGSSTLRIVLSFALSLLCAAALSADEWPHYAGDTARSGIALRAARDLDTIRWSVTPLADEEYVWHSSPVVYGGRAFVNARHYDPNDPNNAQDHNLVIAYDVFDGARRWATPIEKDLYDSWASPAVDVRNQTVLLGSGYRLFALDLETGAIEWERLLVRRIVNASPVVTSDLFNNDTLANRVFITDYDGYGSDARLYAINVDPYDPPNNPYDPGEIVWTELLPGASGNTPAYDEGVVYVTSVGCVVKALDAQTGGLVWENDVDFSGYPQYSGFYAGLTIRDGHAYAASYVFYGTGNNSGLFKFDLTDGEIVWVAPCERTNSIPIVTDQGRIFLSAGIDGYGSATKIQAFQDHGDTATQLWDTYVDTGGGLIVGGWTHQPAYSRGYLYAGTPPNQGGSSYGAYTDLYVLDTTRTPAEPDFIVAHHARTGGSPALADGTLYSFGQDGLFALDPSPACLADLDGDGLVSLSDLATLLGAYGAASGEIDFDSDADLNRDGIVDLSDLAALLGTYGAECP